MIYPWQETQWQSFKQQREQQRLAHAILLTGVVGLGKVNFANQMVASVLCTNHDQVEACGFCHSCQLFSAGNHPDHSFITPESVGKQIKIDQIRQLKGKQELTPTVAKWKTVIINPADSLNINANNSLLKLLEEPQENTLLILISSKPESLPITILSRCQRISFSPPEIESGLDWIKQQGIADNLKNEKVLSVAKGAPLRALELIEENVMDALLQFEGDFETILESKANPVELAKKWQQYDLTMGFNHLQNRVKQSLIDLQGQDNEYLTKRYWYIYDCITNAIKLTSSSNNINKILLIEQFIVSAMDKDWKLNTVINN